MKKLWLHYPDDGLLDLSACLPQLTRLRLLGMEDTLQSWAEAVADEETGAAAAQC